MKSEIARETLVAPRLLPEIQAAAEEDHRAPNELVGEALEIYLKNRRHPHPSLPRKRGREGRGSKGARPAPASSALPKPTCPG
jgi:hypothetical protein